MRYQVLQPLTLHPGALLGLTAEQAAVRSFGLERLGTQYLVVKPVGFKAGEVLEIDRLPKAHAHALQAQTQAQAQAPAPEPARKPAPRRASAPAAQTAEA